jgi:hypothetical protein
MVPRQARLGRSFLGAGKYYLHDINAETSERVTFVHTENIPTSDPHKALKWMAWTAIHAEELKQHSGSDGRGKPCEKPVFAFSLSWHPDDEPELHKWKMVGAGRRALIALGLEEHETLFVGHSDAAPHVHVIVNTIHPETGLVNNLPFSKLKLSKWAEEYEREHGKILCEQRVANNEKRAQGEFVKYQEPEVDLKTRITQIYFASDSGKAFQEALAAEGYRLAQGKRIVIIDQAGEIHSLARQIEGAKAKDVRIKLVGLELRSVDEERAAALKKPSLAPQSKAESNSPDLGRPENGDQRKVPPAPAQRPAPAAARAANSMDLIRSWVDNPSREAASTQLNSMQDRHLAEAGEFTTDIHRKRLTLGVSLEDYYREAELREEIAQLEQTIKESGRLRRIWLSMTGQIPKDPEVALDNMRRTLTNVQNLKLMSRNELEGKIRQQGQGIEGRQYSERSELRPDDPNAYKSKDRPRYHRTLEELKREAEQSAEFEEDDGPYFDL